MSFGDREDELWEAMKPSFKPRLISNPNLRYGRHVVSSTGPFAAKPPTTLHARGDARASLGLVVLRVGTLDGSSEVVPAAHIWVSRAQPWIAIGDGTPCFDETPTPEAFADALAGR